MARGHPGFLHGTCSSFSVLVVWHSFTVFYSSVFDSLIVYVVFVRKCSVDGSTVLMFSWDWQCIMHIAAATLLPLAGWIDPLPRCRS